MSVRITYTFTLGNDITSAIYHATAKYLQYNHKTAFCKASLYRFDVLAKRFIGKPTAGFPNSSTVVGKLLRQIEAEHQDDY